MYFATLIMYYYIDYAFYYLHLALFFPPFCDQHGPAVIKFKVMSFHCLNRQFLVT